ncbi:MAG: NAD(P)-dependent oxidoreductase [Chthoniobacterales bacterium]|nr:NAD(P)-dependent oxidoreductase [Chthoniobacterales bacterium]
MNYLITGATGFIGFNVLLKLLDSSQKEDIIIACVRHGGKLLSLLSEAKIYGIPPKIHLHECSAADWNFKNLPHTPHVCIHCAGALFCRNTDDYFTINVAGTLRLLQALPPQTFPILLSSQSAVGPCLPNSPPIQEDFPPNPISFYGKSKLQMEQVATEFAAQHNRPLLILRPPTVLGPWDSATLPLFKIISSPLWFKPGSREKSLSWIAASDLVDAILTVASSPASSTTPSEIYFVKSDPDITDTFLLNEAGKLLTRSAPILKIPDFLLRRAIALAKAFPSISRAIPSLTPDRALELLHPLWLLDDSRFRKHFSWQPKATLQETLAQTLENYRLRNLL